MRNTVVNYSRHGDVGSSERTPLRAGRLCPSTAPATQLLEATSLLPVPLNLAFAGSAYEREHTVFACLCLTHKERSPDPRLEDTTQKISTSSLGPARRNIASGHEDSAGRERASRSNTEMMD